MTEETTGDSTTPIEALPVFEEELPLVLNDFLRGVRLYGVLVLLLVLMFLLPAGCLSAISR
jgi:hypothetical protein